MIMLSFQFQGAIQLASSLDRELESFYTFPILVRDGGIPERTAYAAVSLTGTSCSKLTMSIVNDSLKFQMAILQIHCYNITNTCTLLFF